MGKAHEAGGEYGPSRGIKAGRGAKVPIKDFAPHADVVYRTMGSGMSPGNEMAVVNQLRRAQQAAPRSIT